jgi:hypothetical protein
VSSPGTSNPLCLFANEYVCVVWGAMTPADYRDRAEACMRIANSQHDADMRQRWVELARQWRMLAVQVEEMGLGEFALDGAAETRHAAERQHKTEK